MNQESRVLLHCRKFRVERVAQTLDDGRERVQDVIRHPGAVVIVPLVDDEHVCLIRNFRVAVNQSLVELPAGTCEPNESPQQTAYRELLEETGFQAGRLDRLTQFYASPGIMDEQMFAYVASELRATEPQREPGEQIENLIVPFRRAIQWVMDGTIQDAKTICGLLVWQMTR